VNQRMLDTARESVRQPGSRPDSVDERDVGQKGFLGVQKGEEMISP